MNTQPTTSLLDEDTITLTQAAKELDVHVATIFRWSSPRGIKGIRLGTVRLGGKRLTSRQEIRRFSDALTAASESHLPVPTHSAAHQRELDAAEAEADRLGL